MTKIGVHDKVQNIWFLSPLVLSKRENLALLSLYTFWWKCVCCFQFLNDKIHNYVKQNMIVNFIIQKLKNKHTLLKKYTNWAKLSSLILREQEETKTKYSAPMWIANSLYCFGARCQKGLPLSSCPRRATHVNFQCRSPLEFLHVGQACQIMFLESLRF